MNVTMSFVCAALAIFCLIGPIIIPNCYGDSNDVMFSRLAALITAALGVGFGRLEVIQRKNKKRREEWLNAQKWWHRETLSVLTPRKKVFRYRAKRMRRVYERDEYNQSRSHKKKTS